MDSISGELQVSDTIALNFEKITSFSLTLAVQDNGLGCLSNQAKIMINLIDIEDSIDLQDTSSYNFGTDNSIRVFQNPTTDL